MNGTQVIAMQLQLCLAPAVRPPLGIGRGDLQASAQAGSNAG